MNKYRVVVYCALFFAIPLVYIFMNYGSLPQTIPIHFNNNGVADGFANKSTLYWMWLIGFVITLLVVLSCTKFYYDKIPTKFSLVLGLSLAIIFSEVIYVVIASAKNQDIDVIKATMITVGLIIILMGNSLVKLKPNLIAGYRISVTLENDEIWRKTHRLAGWLWCGLGLLLIIFAKYVSIVLMIGLLLVVTVIPIFYAYKLNWEMKKESLNE